MINEISLFVLKKHLHDIQLLDFGQNVNKINTNKTNVPFQYYSDKQVIVIPIV